MRRWRRATACALAAALGALVVAGPRGVSAAPGTAAGRSIPALLEACAARLDGERDIGIARVFVVCPEVERAFADPVVRSWLPVGWRSHGEDLSAGSLRELAALLREAEVAPAGRMPDRALLAPILAEYAGRAGDGTGPWGRFLRWLRSIASRSSADAPATQLPDWLGSGSRAERFWTATGYVVFMIALGFVVWIARGELEALGRVWRRAGAQGRPPGGSAALAAPTAESAAAPLAERPGLLLRRVVAALVAQPGLVRAEACTVGELLAARPFADDERAAQLALLASVAEAVRFSPQMPDAATLRAATAAGEALCRQLAEPAP